MNPSGSKGSARPVSELVAKFESGEKAIPGHESDGKAWADLDQAEQQDILNDFRLAYISSPRSTGARGWAPCSPTRRSPPKASPNAATSRCSNANCASGPCASPHTATV